MCGRFGLSLPAKKVMDHFGLPEFDEDLEYAPRWNIAPTQTALVVLHAEDEGRTARMMRWGLVPFWAKDVSIGARMINARAETAAQKPAFRAAFKRRRCLIPVDGFYEWKKEAGGKQPYRIHAAGAELLALAGLWERWTPKDDEGADALETFTILTSEANELLRQVHDRMPVIVASQEYDGWLGAGSDAADILRPFSAEALAMHPIDKRINSPKNDDASLIEPLARL